MIVFPVVSVLFFFSHPCKGFFEGFPHQAIPPADVWVIELIGGVVDVAGVGGLMSHQRLKCESISSAALLGGIMRDNGTDKSQGKKDARIICKSIIKSKDQWAFPGIIGH